MKSTRWIFRSLCATALPIFAGCVAPGPPTYGTYPGYYGPPGPSYGAPPGAMMSPGPYPTPQLGSPTIMPGNPGSSSPPVWSPSSPTPISPSVPVPSQGSLNGNPTYAPPIMGARKPTDITVPDPIDEPRGGGGSMPGAPEPLGPRPLGPEPLGRGPVGPGPTDQNKSPFGTEDGSKTFEPGTQAPPSPRAGSTSEQEIATTSEAFQSPVERDRPSEAVGVDAGLEKTAAKKPGRPTPNPFDYDRKAYTWLRGTVDFDRRDNSWHIVYNPTPDRNDKYGGKLRLTNHPKLKNLHPNDFVYVEGHIKQPDARSKPQFEIEGEQLARITFDGGRQPIAN